MARRSQCSSAEENPLDPNYLPPHYREEYRLAIDALIEADLEGYYGFLNTFNVVDFLSQPEIKYIKCTVQEPRQTAKHVTCDRRHVIGDADGSSDTYWPTHSELDAPELDLGWPQPHRFIGPTEITTLVNPSDPEMPSIKEQARRMIKNAQQVIAIVMDMFTDVDIFTDILNAAMRNVAVYVLLDEYNANHFVAMANNYRINLDNIKFMRVRTISGSTYFCHTGKSFKGQMMNRFMLVDCRVVLSGNYSFMWSFEKIHRCIAHVFLGHLVTTFDEEFRILYAQSEPLTSSKSFTYVDDYGNVPGRQHNIENTHMYNRQYPDFEDNHPEWLEDHVGVGPRVLPYRTGKEGYSSTEELWPFSVSATKPFRGEHPFLEQQRPMKVPNTKEIGGFKRYGYTDVPSYVCVSPQKNLPNRGIQHMEGMELQTSHFPREEYFHQQPGPGYDIYEKSRDQSYHQYDQYSEPSFPPDTDDVEVSGDYDPVQRYLQSYPAIEGEPVGNLLQQNVQSNSFRHSMGPKYALQPSSSEPSLKDQSSVFNIRDQREEQKEGLRDWRINSYLSAFQNTGQLDMADFPKNVPCDNVPYAIQGTTFDPNSSKAKQDNIGITKLLTSRLNTLPVKQMSLPLPVNTSDPPEDNISIETNDTPTPPSASESSCTTDGDNREPKEPNLTHEEFFRRKPSIALQRNSRLRHSLIFNSKLEQNTTEEKRNVLGNTDEDNSSKHDPAIYNILEKKKPSTREPFKWMSLVKSSRDPSTDSTQSEDLPSKTGGSSVKTEDENAQVTPKVAQQKRSLTFQNVPTQENLGENSQVTPASINKHPSFILEREVPFIDMNDPECRLRYFKELAAKRKAKLAEKNVFKATEEKKERDSNLSTLENIKDSNAKDLASYLKYTVANDSRKTQENVPQDVNSCSEIPVTATDAEKIQLKRKLTEDCGSSTDEAQQESTTTTTKDMELSSQPNNFQNILPSHQKNKLPKVTGLLGSTCLGPENLKHEPVNSYANTFAKLSTQESNFNLNGILTANATPKQANSSQPLATTESLYFLSNIAMNDPSEADTSTEHHIEPDVRTLQHPTEAETESACSQQLIEIEVDASQHSNSAGNDCSQRLIKTETVSFHHPTATETDFSKLSTAREADFSKLSTAREADFSKLSTAREADFSKLSTAREADFSKLSTVIETDSFQNSFAKVTGPLEHIPVAEADTPQHPTKTDIQISQHSTETETRSSQPRNAPTSACSKKLIETEGDASQHSTLAGTDCSQQLFEKEVHADQHSSSAGIVCPHQLTEAEVVSVHHPTARKFGPSEHMSAAKTDTPQHQTEIDMQTSQHLTKTETCSSQHPIPSASACSQKLIETEVDDSQHSNSSGTDHSQQLTETETVSFHHHTATETGSSKLLTLPETDSFQNSFAKVTGPSEHIPVAETDTPQHPTETDIPTSQHSTETETCSSQPLHAITSACSQKLIETEVDDSQHSNSSGTDCSQQLPETETDSFHHHTAKESGPAEHMYPAETDTPQHLTETDIQTSQHSTKTETCSSQHPIPSASACSQPLTGTEIVSFHSSTSRESGPSNHISVAKTDTDTPQHQTEMDRGPLQHPAATETCSTQQSIATNSALLVPNTRETSSFQHLSSVGIDCSQHFTVNKTGSSVPSTVTESDCSLHSASTGTDSYQQLSEMQTYSFMPSTETETDTLQHSSATENSPATDICAAEKDTSQHSTEIDIGTLQHPIATGTSTSQHPIATMPACSQHATKNKTECLQQFTETETSAAETDTPQPSTAKEKCPSQHPIATKSTCSQHLPAIKNTPYQHSSATELDCFQQFTETETSSLQNLKSTETGSSKLLAVTKADSSPETGPSKHSHATEINNSQQFATEKGSSQHVITTNSSCSQHVSNTEVGHSPQSTATETYRVQQFTEETGSSPNPSATEIGSFQQLTEVEVASQNTTENDSSSNSIPSGPCQVLSSTSGENLPSSVSSTCSGPLAVFPSSNTNPPSSTPVVQLELCQHASGTETGFYPESCITTNLVNNDNLSLVTDSLDHNSSKVLKPVNLPVTDYEIGQDITSSSMYSSSQPEKNLCCQDRAEATEVQNREVKKEQIQQQEESVGSVSHGTVGISVDLDTNEVDKMKELTKHVKNASYSNAEQKQETCLTPGSVSASQHVAAENTASSSHQSSTANVLSCSNLRDDTKVLLEQISAKNQGKASKLTVDDAKKAEKQISGQVQSKTQTWSAKASDEEREKLLERMANMRKERKVYSRFEVP